VLQSCITLQHMFKFYCDFLLGQNISCDIDIACKCKSWYIHDILKVKNTHQRTHSQAWHPAGTSHLLG
jgi:hypothetical protein